MTCDTDAPARRIMAPSSRAEAPGSAQPSCLAGAGCAAVAEPALEDRLDHESDGLLDPKAKPSSTAAILDPGSSVRGWNARRSRPAPLARSAKRMAPLGMSTRRTACGWYVPSRGAANSSDRLRSAFAANRSSCRRRASGTCFAHPHPRKRASSRPPRPCWSELSSMPSPASWVRTRQGEAVFDSGPSD